MAADWTEYVLQEIWCDFPGQPAKTSSRYSKYSKGGQTKERLSQVKLGE